MQIIVWRRFDLWAREDSVRFDAAVPHSTVTTNQDAVGGACPGTGENGTLSSISKTPKTWLFMDFISPVFIYVRLSASLLFVLLLLLLLLLLPRLLLLLLLAITVAIIGRAGIPANQDSIRTTESEWRRDERAGCGPGGRGPVSPLLPPPPLLALSVVTPFSAALAFAVWGRRLWRAGRTPDRQTDRQTPSQWDKYVRTFDILAGPAPLPVWGHLGPGLLLLLRLLLSPLAAELLWVDVDDLPDHLQPPVRHRSITAASKSTESRGLWVKTSV